MILKLRVIATSLLLPFAGAALFCLSPPASAGYVIQATVVKLRPTEYNAYFVFVDKPIVDRAPCDTSSPQNAFVLDVSTPGGKAMVNALFTAQVTKAKVTISGRGSYPTIYPGNQQCHIWGGIESMNHVDIE